MLKILKTIVGQPVIILTLAVVAVLPLSASAGNFWMLEAPQNCSPINPAWTNDIWNSPNGVVNIGSGNIWVVCGLSRDQQDGANQIFYYIQNIGDTDQEVGCGVREYNIHNAGTEEATFKGVTVLAGTATGDIGVGNPDPTGASSAVSVACKLAPKTVLKALYHRPITDDI